METTTTLSTDQINEGLKQLSKRHNISYDALNKTFYFLKDVKRELDKNPNASLTALTTKHSVTNNWVSVLYEKVVSKPKDKPNSYKVWSGGDVTPRLAFDLFNFKKNYVRDLNSKNTSVSSKKNANNIGNIAGIDSGRYDFETKSHINAAAEDFPEGSFVQQKILGFFRCIKEMVDEDPEQALGYTAKEFGVPTYYLTYLKSYGLLQNTGKQTSPRYEWIGKVPQKEDALKAYDKYTAITVKKREERKKKKEEKKRQIAEQEREEQLMQRVKQMNGGDQKEDTAKAEENNLVEEQAQQQEEAKEQEHEEAEMATVHVKTEIPRKGGNAFEVEDFELGGFFKVQAQNVTETKAVKLFGLTIFSVTKTKKIQ